MHMCADVCTDMRKPDRDLDPNPIPIPIPISIPIPIPISIPIPIPIPSRSRSRSQSHPDPDPDHTHMLGTSYVPLESSKAEAVILSTGTSPPVGLGGPSARVPMVCTVDAEVGLRPRHIGLMVRRSRLLGELCRAITT